MVRVAEQPDRTTTDGNGNGRLTHAPTWEWEAVLFFVYI